MKEIRDLYKKFGKDIYRFSLHLSGNVADAEDLTAETFLKAVNYRGEFYTQTVKSFLMTIARNLYVESLRKKQRQATHSSEEATFEFVTGSLETEFEKSETLNYVLAFLQTVDEQDRAALLFRVDGMSYREISTVLGISEVAVKVKVHRLRTKLKEIGK